ncbi:hypothetical protein ACFXJ5_09395 [Streptomyces sp. NPDC059373]
MMSDAKPGEALQPRWMPTGDETELCGAGEWWDAIRVPEAIGTRVIELLKAGSQPVGPVILDQEGLEPRLYFLVPVGVSAGWDEPETVALGHGCHVVVPPYDRVSATGLHWHYLPRGPRIFTEAEALRRALIQARRGPSTPVPDQEPAP